MRVVVQRVSSARVTSGGQTVGVIGVGLVVFVGISRLDGPADVRYMADKIAGLRIFSDEVGKMNRAVGEAGGAALVVSQFTLYGDCRKGRRPSFDAAAPPEAAAILYGDFVCALRETGVRVETGVFQEHMSVDLANDGPVTILIDSARQF